MIFTEKLGLINKLEVNDSDVTNEAAEKFIKLPNKDADSLGYASLDPGTGSTMDLVNISLLYHYYQTSNLHILYDLSLFAAGWIVNEVLI